MSINRDENFAAYDIDCLAGKLQDGKYAFYQGGKFVSQGSAAEMMKLLGKSQLGAVILIDRKEVERQKNNLFSLEARIAHNNGTGEVAI